MAESSWARAVAKSAVWKIIGVITLVIVSIAAGISAVEIGKITIAYHVITLFLYVAHERIWNAVSWGKRRNTGEKNMESIIIEIRAAEGGDDAKLLVVEQLKAYVNVGDQRGL